MLGLFNRQTAVGRTGRTFVQAVAGLLLFLLPSDEFRTLITQLGYTEWLIYIPTIIAGVTFVMNYLDPKVPNTEKDLAKNFYER